MGYWNSAMIFSVKNKFYATLSCFILAGWGWLFVASRQSVSSFTPCVFKNITGIPCPSCGSTRAVVAILNGRFMEAFLLNPLGYLLIILAIALPIWLLVDLITKKEKIRTLFHQLNSFTKSHPIFLFSFLTLIAINWIWNIYKHL